MIIKRILTISSTTTPALVTAQLNLDATYGAAGWGYGNTAHPVIRIQAVRANGAAMTAVVFQLQASWDGTTWFIVPCRKASAVTDLTVVAPTQTMTVANNSTAEDALVGPDLQGIPLLRVLAQAVTADAVAGCSAGAWVTV